MARLEIAGFRLQLYQRLRCKPSKNRLLFIENSKMSVVQDELITATTSTLASESLLATLICFASMGGQKTPPR
jgi:hypothetical protein